LDLEDFEDVLKDFVEERDDREDLEDSAECGEDDGDEGDVSAIDDLFVYTSGNNEKVVSNEDVAGNVGLVLEEENAFDDEEDILCVDDADVVVSD
jgi:DNA polymerase II small subunit/DNA polymerase delta subunit B